MSQTVVGIFDSSTEAQNAVQRLSENGFTIDQVDLTYNSGSVLENEGSTETVHRDQDENGFGERVSRFFKSLFDDDSESDRYSRVASNAAIVTVIADSSDKALRAAQIMDDCGAIDVDERYGNMGSTAGSVTSDNYSADSTRAGDLDTDRNYNSGDSNSIPVVEEELHVGKREVDRGTVRVRSRIIERPVEEHIRLREERVTVERNAVNRPATEGDLSTLREGEIELKQRAEVPVVNKEARVVEEVRLNRDVVERDETVRDTVRKTQVDIDEDVTDDVINSDQTKRRQDNDLLD